jgi:DNA (cytosine-5)-methyltransferase 1
MNPETFKANDFVIKAEEYGIPQARHRVILLGVRSDITNAPCQLDKESQASVNDAIQALPHLRSRLSKRLDNGENWAKLVTQHLQELYTEALESAHLSKLADELDKIKYKISSELGYGGLRCNFDKISYNKNKAANQALNQWYEDHNLEVWLNHETRGHMDSDLKRYLYASTYALANRRSPKGHEEFSLSGLRPDHVNWESGKFSDRFRVQIGHKPATTVTSHISKDGHYFIHPDPSQCRSLTVREAARIQTFPDNYFFQGNRTQQFHQVGNAVPPLLAFKIAEKVYDILK